MSRLRMIALLIVVGCWLGFPKRVHADDYVVYSVFRPLDLGIPGETPQKDYFVNLGSAQGIHPGSTIEVIRKMPTYDLSSQKLYKDVSFPIATLKVIHAENGAAIARLEKFYSTEKTPSYSPRAVMVGDVVRSVH